MAVYMSALQVDGARRYHVITADRDWELRNAARDYAARVVTKNHKSSFAITPNRRLQKKMLEDRGTASFSGTADTKPVREVSLETSPSDYVVRERERRSSSVEKLSGGRTSERKIRA